MNRTHRIVFNRHLGLWQVASELAHGQGKGGCPSHSRLARRARAVAGLAAALAIIGGPPGVWAQSVTGGGDVAPGGAPAQTPSWIVSSLLTVGGGGTGWLSIEGGGTLITTAGASIGARAAGIGAVSVSGQGSLWDSWQSMEVGGYGTGTLNIADAGRVSVVNVLTLGQTVGSVGTINIGAASTNAADARGAGMLDTPRIDFGAGAATLNFNHTDSSYTFGTVLNSASTGTHALNHYAGVTRLTGDSSGFKGTTTVAGGTLVIANVLGTSAGQIDSASALAPAGVEVSGALAAWRANGDILVGGNRDGHLTIDGGGQVTNTSARINATQGTARATVTGAGSLWASRSGLHVGADGGSGRLDVMAGGRVTSNDAFVGRYGGNGAVTVSGAGSIWSNDGYLRVGERNGIGSVSIEAGGLLVTQHSIIGRLPDSFGSVSVSGAASRWSNAGGLILGDGYLTNYGSGALTIADGGTVELGIRGSSALSLGVNGNFASAGAGTLTIGAASTDPLAAVGAGILQATRVEFGTGSDSLNFNHTAVNYRFDPALIVVGTGSHAVNHYAGVTHLAADSSRFDGTTTVAGGTLIVDNRLGGSASVIGTGHLRVDGTFIGNVSASARGEVGGVGRIQGDLDASSSGVIGGQQGQTLAVTGNLTLGTSSAINVALGGATGNALFDVGGNLRLEGTLNVTDQGGFGAGIYRLFNYGGSLTYSGVVIGTTPAGVRADNLSVQTAVAGQVNLLSTIGNSLGFWDGGDPTRRNNGVVDGGNGTWRADGHNWTGADGAANGPFQPNPTFAVFQGVAGTVQVDGSAGALGVTGMQFATDGYRVQGDAITLQGAGGQSIIRVGDGTTAGTGQTATIASALTGASTLVKSDYGTLVLSGVNTYTGGTELRGGTLRVSADANLGAAQGGVTFTGGTLASTGSFDTARAVMLTQSGVFDVAAGTELGLTGTVSGSGNLTKLGTGTLRLDNTGNAYGNTVVQSGTLIGNAASISGQVGNAGTVIFDQATDAHFAGDIVGFDGTNGSMVKRGAGGLVLGGTSVLDWSIQAGGLTSAAERFSGNAAIASGASLTFGQATDANYAGVLSGSGVFNKTGTGTLSLSGNSAGFAGTTSIAGGRLALNGALGGSLIVGSGAVLGGNGTIGSGQGSHVTIASGGTLSPGNSIGTLTVNGDLTVQRDARFVVEVNPLGTEADLVHVTGKATLDGGTVAHVGASGDYQLRSTYTILTADGALSGKFDSVTSDFAFLAPSVSYDYAAGKVMLDLKRNDIGFATVAGTRNQRATAAAIDSIGLAAGHAVYDAVALLPDDQALVRASFDGFSGEIYASAKTALIEDSRFVRDAATGRLRAAFDGVGASAAPVMTRSDGRNVLAAPNAAGPVSWIQAFGSWGHSDSDGNAARLRRSTGGVLLGLDTSVLGDNWRVGALAGYSHTSLDADNASSGGSDNYHLGLYGGTQWGALGLRTGVAYSWNNLDTRRSVAVAGMNDSLKANADAGTAQAFADLGYRIDARAVALEPFANLAYVHLHTDGFREQGGAAALQASGQNTDTTFTTLGTRVSTRLEFGGADVTARGALGWRHAFGDVTPLATLAFSAGGAFTVAGVPIAKDSAVIEAGFDVKVGRTATLGLAYQGQIAGNAQDHGVQATLNVRF
ncbi:outer membrane autotransporter barrel domain-containing protein [Cupriavidus sp. TKC]|uniref:autotransporter domain-containing protein n=1 Tax=unclassified Cupriavidus TaxID=2640874 RepID=UPI002581196F|nr:MULTISPECIES: autotransporter domain-containing protein [unclassified Cupriavidus]GMG94315.1 outer membrane autotransporter barrel domain-containing protein [Cupriavidus sp. TKC]